MLLNMLTKQSKDLHAMGMAAVSCTHHQMFRALGMGDLQKGERCVPFQTHSGAVRSSEIFSQCNINYLFTSSIAGVGIQMLTLSYDVGCHWFIKLWACMNNLPAALKLLLPTLAIRALVPKFHLQSHEEKCHSTFSFNYSKGCGWTDGEGVECNWDELNGQAPSTAEMVPGHHWETLNDCCRWANFHKTIGLGTFPIWCLNYLALISLPFNLLLKQLLLAIHQALESCHNFVAFNSNLCAKIPNEVKEMEQDLAAWELSRSGSIVDQNLHDPY